MTKRFSSIRPSVPMPVVMPPTTITPRLNQESPPTSKHTSPENVRVRLDLFSGSDLDRGRSRLVEIAWILMRRVFISSSFPWPSELKATVLRAFGARVGKNLYMRPRVYIHFPWKLEIEDHCWIGEGCEVLNLEPVVMRSHSSLAHHVYLAAAGHDITSPTMEYANAPIEIFSGAWIGTRAFIGAGVRVGENSVVGAGAVVVRDVEAGTVVGGVPAKVIGTRTLDARVSKGLRK